MQLNAHYIHFYRYDGANKEVDTSQRLLSVEFSTLTMNFELLPNTFECFRISRQRDSFGFCPEQKNELDAVIRSFKFLNDCRSHGMEVKQI